MSLQLDDLVIDLKGVDVDSICNCWNWCLKDFKKVIMISRIGDMFFEGSNKYIYWLRTDNGDISKVADNHQEFFNLLKDEENIENWFLASLIEELLDAEKYLGQNQVYSFKKMPILGGAYHKDNIWVANVLGHFCYTAQIWDRIKDLPDGTSVKINIVD